LDALSEVLRSVQLDGALYLDAEFTAPWALLGKYGMASVRKRLAGAEHIVFFHYLMAGRCKIRLAEGGEVLDVAEGDLVLFPQDDRHLMGSDLNLAPLQADNLSFEESERGDERFVRVRHGGGGEVTRFVCGYLACNRSVLRAMLEALPRLMRISLRDGAAGALMRDLLKFGIQESAQGQPGSSSSLAKVAELMFVEAMRKYVAELPDEARGLLAGIRDAHVGRALALMHADPAKSWTVDSLAREVAMSRSVLAERFAHLLGEPPMQYLTRWRLAVAARSLRSTTEPITRVAQRCGYESEAAFNRAFKREFGLPPATWRRSSVLHIA
jgi:AraC-like DNA-binding protein